MLAVPVDSNGLLEESEWAAYELLLHRLALAFEQDAGDPEIVEKLNAFRDTVLDTQDRLRAQRYLERAASLLCKKEALHLVFLFDEADVLYQAVDVRFLNSLRALRDEHKYRLCFVLFTRTTLDRLRDAGESEAFYELFNRNVMGLKPYRKEDALRVLDQLQVRRGHPLSEKERGKLAELSGGHPGLLVALFETVLSQGSSKFASPADWLAVPSVGAECRKLWDGLDVDEQISLLRLHEHLTDRDSTRARELLALKGLIADADDVQPKVFCPTFGHFVSEIDMNDVYDFVVDEATVSVRVAGTRISGLTNLEFALVSQLYEHPGEVLSREDILKALYPDEFKEGVVPNVQDNRVDTIVKRLRAKVEPTPPDPRYILTVRGRGYKLKAPPDKDPP
jgi:DNA-binding winged helix-turn-helix (wHTH) protein